MNELQDARIADHGHKLLEIFPWAKERDPIKLYKRLRRLQAQAEQVTLRLCNGPEYDDEATPDRLLDAVLGKVKDLLGVPTEAGYDVPIFVNRDPRGYALKVDDEWMRTAPHAKGLHTDWGGYGILAPEIDGKD